MTVSSWPLVGWRCRHGCSLVVSGCLPQQTETAVASVGVAGWLGRVSHKLLLRNTAALLLKMHPFSTLQVNLDLLDKPRRDITTLHPVYQIDDPLAFHPLQANSDLLDKPSIWIVGGDGWAYDVSGCPTGCLLVSCPTESCRVWVGGGWGMGVCVGGGSSERRGRWRGRAAPEGFECSVSCFPGSSRPSHHCELQGTTPGTVGSLTLRSPLLANPYWPASAAR